MLLFLSLEQITKELDISVYTGQKIKESCRFALHFLVEDHDFRKQETLRKDLCDFFVERIARSRFKKFKKVYCGAPVKHFCKNY